MIIIIIMIIMIIIISISMIMILMIVMMIIAYVCRFSNDRTPCTIIFYQNLISVSNCRFLKFHRRVNGTTQLILGFVVSSLTPWPVRTALVIQ